MLKKSRSGAAETEGENGAATGRGRGATGLRFTLKPSKQTCIALGGIMGLLLTGSVGLYFWQSGVIADQDKKVHDRETDLANSEKIARDLESVRQKNVETRGQLRFLETSVTEGQYVPTLLHQTEDLAKSTNLKVAAIRPTMEPAPKPPVDKEAAKKFKPQPYDKIHIDMEVSGKYWDIARMLYRLTEFPKILSVENMQATPINDPKLAQGGSPSLTVRMKLTGFIFPNDGTKPANSAVGGAAPVTPGVPATGTPKPASGAAAQSVSLAPPKPSA